MIVKVGLDNEETLLTPIRSYITTLHSSQLFRARLCETRHENWRPRFEMGSLISVSSRVHAR